MKKIKFTVPFVEGKGRPRFVRRGNFIQTYTPKPTQIAEKKIKQITEPLFLTEFTCPIQIEITYYLYRNEKVITRGPRKGIKEVKIPRKIDTDNVTKLVKDALIGVAYVDDFQVRKDTCQYYFVPTKDEEKTEVTIIALEEDTLGGINNADN